MPSLGAKRKDSAPRDISWRREKRAWHREINLGAETKTWRAETKCSARREMACNRSDGTERSSDHAKHTFLYGNYSVYEKLIKIN